MTAASNGRVCAVAVKCMFTVPAPASPNGPLPIVGSASQVCGATIGSDTVTDGLVPTGPASRSGSPSNDRSSVWSAGNGETSKLNGPSPVAAMWNESDSVGTRAAGNGPSGAFTIVKSALSDDQRGVGPAGQPAVQEVRLVGRAAVGEPHRGGHRRARLEVGGRRVRHAGAPSRSAGSSEIFPVNGVSSAVPDIGPNTATATRHRPGCGLHRAELQLDGFARLDRAG